MSDKPKEYYIIAKHEWYGDFYECHTKVPNTKNCHVIEYSAYEQLKEQVKDYEQALDKILIEVGTSTLTNKIVKEVLKKWSGV